MPINPTTLKALIDTQITNETVDFAITPTEVGSRMKDTIDYTTEQIVLKEDTANKQTDLTASATKFPTVNAVNTGLAAKEPTITAGTTGQYYRGDKTFQTLDKTAVGLANIDNTSDVNKPVSTAQQTALDLKENKLKTIGNISATSSSYPILSNDINNIIGTYDGHVLLPVTTQVGKEVVVISSSIGFYVDVSNVSTMSIAPFRMAEVVTSYRIPDATMFKFTYVDNGKWIAERLSDSSIKIDGAPLSYFSVENNINLTFYSLDTSLPSLSTLNSNYAFYPNGFRIFYPNMSGGAIMITKLYSNIFYQTTLGTIIT